MMLATRVIRRPVVTEKAAFASGTFNRHTFEICPQARKADVKAAVEELYGVRVQGVAIQNRKDSRDVAVMAIGRRPRPSGPS